MTLRIKPTNCGLPYHGLVTNGVLPLVNGKTKYVSQPGASSILMNQARSPDPTLIGDDQSKGWSWKDRLLIPGVTGIGVDELIFIDDANIPYLIRLEATRPASKTVRVVATLVREYGIIDDSHIDDFNIELFDTTFDLTQSGTASLVSFKTPLDLIVNRVEQSPDGHGAFINLAGNYFDNGSSLVGIDKYTSAAILKATFSGEFNQLSQTGVTGSIAVHKTVDECVGQYSTVANDQRTGVGFRLGETDSVTSWVPGPGSNDWYQALINMSSTFFTSEIIYGTLTENIRGTNMAVDEQVMNQYAHYDNDGNEVTLAHRITKTVATTHAATGDYSCSPDPAIWSYHCDHPFGSNPGRFTADIHSPAAGVPLTKTQQENTSSVETRSYKVECLINDAPQQTKEYVWEHLYSRVWIREFSWGEWPRSFVGQFVSADQNDEEAPWLFPNFSPTSYLAPTTKQYVAWSDGSYGGTETEIENTITDAYTSTEWGEELYSGPTAPTDEQFSNFDFSLNGFRFLTLENTRTNSKAAAQSVYGATGPDHATNIAYDPYTDTITDSDDPIGYL